MMRVALLIAAAGLTAAADSPTRELDGRVAGKPVDCVTTTRLGNPQIVGDGTLLYRDGARIWRNDLPDACPGLNDDAIVVSEVYGGQQCRGDGFTTIRRGGLAIPGARCRLGAFVPWERAKGR